MEKKKPSKKPAKKKPVKKASVKRKKKSIPPPEPAGSCSCTHSLSYTFTNADSFTSDIPGYDHGSEEGDMTGVEIHIVNASVPKADDAIASLKKGVKNLLKRLRTFCGRGGQEEQSI